jgi:hypothetical protein
LAPQPSAALSLAELCFQELALWFQGLLLLEHGTLGLRGPD